MGPELAALLEGNRRFLDGASPSASYTGEPVDRPSVLVLCCSCLQPPEVLFDQPPGRLLVHQSAGLSLGESALAAVRFDVELHGVRHVVLVGHRACPVPRSGCGRATELAVALSRALPQDLVVVAAERGDDASVSFCVVS